MLEPVVAVGEQLIVKENALVATDAPDATLPTNEIVPSELSVQERIMPIEHSMPVVGSGSPLPFVESTPTLEPILQTSQPSPLQSAVQPVQSIVSGETEVPPSSKLKSAVRKKPPEALIAMLTSTKAKQKVAPPPVIPAMPVLTDPKALEASLSPKPSTFPIATREMPAPPESEIDKLTRSSAADRASEPHRKSSVTSPTSPSGTKTTSAEKDAQFLRKPSAQTSPDRMPSMTSTAKTSPLQASPGRKSSVASSQVAVKESKAPEAEKRPSIIGSPMAKEKSLPADKERTKTLSTSPAKPDAPAPKAPRKAPDALLSAIKAIKTSPSAQPKTAAAQTKVDATQDAKTKRTMPASLSTAMAAAKASPKTTRSNPPTLATATRKRSPPQALMTLVKQAKSGTTTKRSPSSSPGTEHSKMTGTAPEVAAEQPKPDMRGPLVPTNSGTIVEDDLDLKAPEPADEEMHSIQSQELKQVPLEMAIVPSAPSSDTDMAISDDISMSVRPPVLVASVPSFEAGDLHRDSDAIAELLLVDAVVPSSAEPAGPLFQEDSEDALPKRRGSQFEKLMESILNETPPHSRNGSKRGLTDSLSVESGPEDFSSLEVRENALARRLSFGRNGTDPASDSEMLSRETSPQRRELNTDTKRSRLSDDLDELGKPVGLTRSLSHVSHETLLSCYRQYRYKMFARTSLILLTCS